MTINPELAALTDVSSSSRAAAESGSSSRAASPAMMLGIPLPGMEEDQEYLEKCSNDSKGSTPSSSEVVMAAPVAVVVVKPKSSSWFGFGSSTPRAPSAQPAAAPVVRKKPCETADQKLARKREQRSAVLAQQWVKIILPAWQSQRSLRSTKVAVWEGIPSKVRSQAWLHIVGNR